MQTPGGNIFMLYAVIVHVMHHSDFETLIKCWNVIRLNGSSILSVRLMYQRKEADSLPFHWIGR